MLELLIGTFVIAIIFAIIEFFDKIFPIILIGVIICAMTVLAYKIGEIILGVIK